MTDDVNKVAPTTDDMLELLAALRDEAEAGRLKVLLFALQDPRVPDNAIIDAYGPHDWLEIACRKQIEHIAAVAEQFNPQLAAAIRNGIAGAGGRVQ